MRFNTLSRLAFSIITLASVFAQSENDFASCTNGGKIKTMKSGKAHYEVSNYCSNSTGTTLVSANCLDVKACIARLPAIKFNIEDLQAESGKPGFALCRKLGGHGQIIEFEAKSVWWKLDRCLFESGDWFVDTGFLVGYYLRSQSR